MEMVSLKKIIQLSIPPSFHPSILFHFDSFLSCRPFVFYEEEGLLLEKSNVLAFLLMYLRHFMFAFFLFLLISFRNGTEITAGMLSETLSYFSTHQIELTTLPLITRIVRNQPSLRFVAPEGFETIPGANWPVQYLVEQVIKRMLQFCRVDPYPLLSCLDIIPIERAPVLIQHCAQLSEDQPRIALDIAVIGVAYCCLLGLWQLLELSQRLYRGFYWISFLNSRGKQDEITPEFLFKAFPQQKEGEPFFAQSITEMCLSAEMNLDAVGTILLESSIQNDQQENVRKIIDSLQERIRDVDLLHILENVVVKTHQRRFQRLLCIEIERLQIQNALDTSFIHTCLEVLDFCDSHDDLLHDIDGMQLVNRPWEVLKTFVTFYNYTQFLILFSILSITMQDVVLHLLEQFTQQAEIPPDWREIQELLEMYADEENVQERCLLCIAIAERYSHSPSHCQIYPCSRCEDRVSAYQFACDLSESAILSLSEQRDDSNQQRLSELKEVALNCRKNYSRAVYFYQWNRLFLSHESLPTNIFSDDLESDFQANASSIADHLLDLYFKLSPLAGEQLRKRSSEVFHGSSSLRMRFMKLDAASRKRMSDTSITRDCKSRSFHLVSNCFFSSDCDSFSVSEVQNMIDQLRDETHSSWFVFSHEGCGLLFLHSIMETLCSSFQLSFQQLFLCTIDKLLQHWRRIESTGNCAQEIEENCLSSAVNGLIYMLRGLQEMNRDTFVSITSQYAQQAIDSSSAFFPYAAKYIILSSVAFSLSFFSQSQQKSVLLKLFPQDSTLTLSELQRNALIQFTWYGCQKFRIPVGTDVWSQVQNPSFLSNVMRSHASEESVLWWCTSLMQRMNVQAIQLWDQMLRLCAENQFFSLCVVCLAQHQQLARYHSDDSKLTREEAMSIVDTIVNQWLKPNHLKPTSQIIALLGEFGDDKHIPAWCKSLFADPNDAFDASEFASDLCSLVMRLQNVELRRSLLHRAIKAGAALAVMEQVCFEGKILSMYDAEFIEAARTEMNAGHFDALFHSDLYAAVLSACVQEADSESLLNAWIIYHIKRKHFEEAIDVLSQTRWSEESEMDGDSIAQLRFYIHSVLQDDDLLVYLLSLSPVSNKHTNPGGPQCL